VPFLYSGPIFIRRLQLPTGETSPASGGTPATGRMTNRAVVGECIVVTRCATGGGTVVKPHTRARTLKTRAAHPRQRPREAASCRGIACTAGSSGDDDQGILGNPSF